MKKQVTLLLIVLISSLSWNVLEAQTADNDPKAKKLLDELKKDYDSYKSMEMNFTLTLDLPGEPAQLQEGNVLQQGDKYRLKMEQQAIYSDGTTMWVHLISNNEVQINDVELEGGDFMSPKDLLSIYENGEYEYQLLENQMVNEKKVHLVEFKPTTPNAEYTKMRLSINAKNKGIEQLMIFSRDGSRYSLDIHNITPNKKINDADFVFDASKYKDIYIEDLRID